MKIVYCKNGFDSVDGSAEHLTSYALQAKGAGQSPSVILLNPCQSDNQYLIRLKDARVPVSWISGMPLALALRATRRIALARARLTRTPTALTWNDIVFRTLCSHLRKHSPDLVHTFVDPGAPVAIRASSAAGVPVLCHELISPRVSAESQGYYDELARLLPLCSVVAAQSTALAQECRERIPFSGTVSVLPNIVDGPKASDVTIRQTTNKVVFGFASRLEARKGAMVLIDAFASIAARFPGAGLKIAGGGPEERQLIDRARSLGIMGQCEFVGTYFGVKEKNNILRSFDVLVHPAFAEGIPNTMIEAMANGCGIIASNVGGIPESVSNRSAILVPPGDVNSLAMALERVAGDAELRTRLSQAARKEYEEKFSPAAVLPILLDTYQSMSHRLPVSVRDTSLDTAVRARWDQN